MRLVPDPPGRIESGRALLDGRDLLSLPESEMRRVRGRLVSMVFQEPMTSLNPVFTAGHQVDEVLRLHLRDRRAGGAGADDRPLRPGSASPTPGAATASTPTASRAACASG